MILFVFNSQVRCSSLQDYCNRNCVINKKKKRKKKEMPDNAVSPAFDGSRGFQLHSVEKISNLPVISSTINLTQGLYGKVKESTTASKMILELAEHSVQKAAQLVEPVATTLEKPISLADSLVCNTIDFVGNQIGKATAAPQKLTNAISGPVQPAMDYMKTVGNYGFQQVGNLYNKLGTPTTPKEMETEMESENESECENENEPGKRDCGTQTLMTGNVRNKVKIFSKH